MFLSILRVADHETAASAVRNLNNTDVGGRLLRIDLADSDPFLEGKTTVRGELVDGGFPGPSEMRGSQGKSRESNPFLNDIPPGMSVPPDATALDMISKTLATMDPTVLMEVLAQMKVRDRLDTSLCVSKPSPKGLCDHPSRRSPGFISSTSTICICPVPGTCT